VLIISHITLHDLCCSSENTVLGSKDRLFSIVTRLMSATNWVQIVATDSKPPHEYRTLFRRSYSIRGTKLATHTSTDEVKNASSPLYRKDVVFNPLKPAVTSSATTRFNTSPFNILPTQCMRDVRKVTSHFEYLENCSRGLDVTWQPIRGDLTAHPCTISLP